MSFRNVTAVLALTTLCGVAAGQCASERSACSGGAPMASANVMLASYHAEGATIVETAKEAGIFNTLLAAAKAAGLAEALMGDGPFTVFAPTDDAFAKLPKGTVESLLEPQNKGKLAAILKYHVVPGVLNASEVTRMSGAETLNGQRVSFTTSSGGVRVDEASVVKADIACSNGVIHVIDSVILPEQGNIVEVAANAKQFSTLLAAAGAAGLAEALMGDGPFTVFAPTDDAFAKLPKGTVESLLEPQNKGKLAAILKYHVVSGRVSAAQAAGAGQAKTLNGGSVVLGIVDGRLRVDGASVISSDIDASNGVIHVIDRVILPQ